MLRINKLSTALSYQPNHSPAEENALTMSEKNPHAVALGRIKTDRKKVSSQRNARMATPPVGMDRPLWRRFIERVESDGLTIPHVRRALYARNIETGL